MLDSTTAGHATIAAALAAAQSEMGKALKQSNNPHFRMKYADLGNVMDACLPALTKNGICLVQPTGRDTDGHYVDTVLIHASGESLSCRVYLILSKQDMQGYGSAVTYARRYGLMCMAGIAPEDDDGNAAVENARQAPRQQARQEPARDAGPSPVDIACDSLRGAETMEQLVERWGLLSAGIKSLPEVIGAKDLRKSQLQARPALAEEIPY
jgi:hypothetical protein